MHEKFLHERSLLHEGFLLHEVSILRKSIKDWIKLIKIKLKLVTKGITDNKKKSKKHK